MNEKRFLTAAIGVASFLTLLFGIGAGHPLLVTSIMPGMGPDMAPGQCQSSCTPQINTGIHSQKTVIDDKDIEPTLAEPYYVAFLSVGWSLVIAAGIYLLWHLRWRPPDKIKLNVAYRF